MKQLRLLPGLPWMLLIRPGDLPVICVGVCALFGITGLNRSVYIVIE